MKQSLHFPISALAAILFALTILLTSTPAQAQGVDVSSLPVLNETMRAKLGLAADNERPIVVDFNATWCMPCLRFAPIYDKCRREYRGKINLLECDVDEHRDIMGAYRVSSIPTIIFFDKDGNPVDRYAGVPDEYTFKKMLDALLEQSAVESVISDPAPDSDNNYYRLDGTIAPTTDTTLPAPGIYIHAGKAVIIK